MNIFVETIIMSYTMDILCLYGNDKKYVVKELAIAHNSTLSVDSYIFLPPYDFDTQRTNIWLEKYFHGLNWYYGDLPYTCLSSILTNYSERCKEIFVKGVDKYTVLKSMLPKSLIINLETLGCPPIRDLVRKKTPSCVYHLNTAPFYKCAKVQAVALAEWHKKFRYTPESWD